ncbi:MAG: SpoIIE family protein phosphatase [Bacteroidota bacterium]
MKLLKNVFLLKNHFILVLFLCTAFSLNIFAEDGKDSIRQELEKNHHEENNNGKLDLHFNYPWKFKIGDNSSWAATDFDDSDWKNIINGGSKMEWFLDSNLVNVFGIIWFRTAFDADSSEINKPLALYLEQIGSACEIYLDGKFLASFGKVGKNIDDEEEQQRTNSAPAAIALSETGKHFVAIRYSSFHSAGNKYDDEEKVRGIELVFKDLGSELKDFANPSKYFSFIIFFTAFLTLGVVHTIKFIYFRTDKMNLFFGLYCLVIAFIFFYGYTTVTSFDYKYNKYLAATIGFIAPLIVVPLVALYQSIYYKRLLKVFWIIVILYAISLIAGVFFPGLKTFFVTVLIIISVIEILRVNINAIDDKTDGAKILGWGFFYVILMPIVSMIVSTIVNSIKGDGSHGDLNLDSVAGYSIVFSIPFSITLYLSKNFAMINKMLSQQVKEINELYAKTLMQESEKKNILESQKEKLEQQVAERTLEISYQKNLVESKNKDITDSINYAKRIQSAILPDIKIIQQTFRQSFILYLPKDIVSGDFYLFAQKNDRVLVAAADCTGHGVAGAFMSMIGSSLLNQIINEKGITEPAKILNQLNNEIVQSLKQKETESNDGMDISICSINLKNNDLQFAGANRPLYLIRKNEIAVYPPDKFPIGGLQILNDESFTNHTIKLQAGDTLYFFSDGYADQFGGEKAKKMMTKKFKEILLSIQNLSMQEQENHLKEYFEKWKGKYEQVDDVLIIGIRV